MGEWQPIETAPKDGIEVLLWCPAEGTQPGYHDIGFWDPGSTDRVEAWRDAVGMCVGDPTHWQPLPEPPQS